MAIGRKITGRLDEPGQQGRLGQGDVFQVFVEVGARRLGQSADGEGAALSEINPVRVEFENLLLAELLLQLDRNQHLHQFSLQSFFGRQEESPGELHGDGGTALFVFLVGEINPRRFHQAKIIHAIVLKEAAIFNGQDRIHHHLGNIVVLDQLPLGALFRVEQGSHQLRLEFISSKFARPVLDGIDLASTEANLRGIWTVIGLRPGTDVDAAPHQAIAAQRRLSFALGIAGTTQQCSDLLGVDFFSYLDRLRQSVDPRGTTRSEEHTSELQSLTNLVCRLLLEKKKNNDEYNIYS